MYKLITREVYKSLEEMFLRLKRTESWRGKIPTQEGFSKEDKEALNVIIFALFKPLMLDESDDVTALPAYLVRRLYRKAYTWDGKPSNMGYFRELAPDFDARLEDYILEMMRVRGIETFAEFIGKESGKLPEKVSRVYKAARVFANLVEFEEMEGKLRADTAEETRQQIMADTWEFSDLPYFNEIVHGTGEYRELKTLIKAVSASRYIFRWQGYVSNVRCSILAHMLESAVIAYLMDLEKGDVSAEEMLQDFWVLMFQIWLKSGRMIFLLLLRMELKSCLRLRSCGMSMALR